MLTGPSSANHSRKPEIMADAAYVIFTQDPKPNGQFFIDDDVLTKAGVKDLDQYVCNPEYKDKLMPDFFVDDKPIAMSMPGAPSLSNTSKGESKSGGSPSGKIGNVFKAIEANLSEQLVSKTQAVYQFNVTGEEAGTWFIDLKNGKGSCGYGEPPSKPDATLSMDSKNFFDMFAGKLKAPTAYMMGKLKISGNLQKALKLEKLMGSLKAKL